MTTTPAMPYGAILVIITFLISAPSLQAQSLGCQPGWWVGAGAGVGSGSFTCADCQEASWRTGPAGTVAIGYTFSDRLEGGLEIAGWQKTVDGIKDHFGFASALIRIFPTRSGLFVTGGFGFARFTSKLPGWGARLSGSGPGARAGLGWDLRLSREVSIVPKIDYFRGLKSDLKIDGRATGIDIKHQFVQAGVGVQWRWWPIVPR